MGAELHRELRCLSEWQRMIGNKETVIHRQDGEALARVHVH